MGSGHSLRRAISYPRKVCVKRARPSSMASTYPVEHIGEPTNSPGLSDEWVTEDLVPLGITIEVL